MAGPHSNQMTNPYIRSGMDDEGRAWIEVEDTELFDFVEDFLIEDHGLEYLGVRTHDEPGRATCHTMVFDGDLLPKLRTALALIDPQRIHEIYLINNPDPAG